MVHWLPLNQLKGHLVLNYLYYFDYLYHLDKFVIEAQGYDCDIKVALLTRKALCAPKHPNSYITEVVYSASLTAHLPLGFGVEGAPRRVIDRLHHISHPATLNTHTQTILDSSHEPSTPHLPLGFGVEGAPRQVVDRLHHISLPAAAQGAVLPRLEGAVEAQGVCTGRDHRHAREGVTHLTPANWMYVLCGLQVRRERAVSDP